MPPAKARAPAARPAPAALTPRRAVRALLGGALLGCGAPDHSAEGLSEAARAGYEGVNFYETNADAPPSLESVPLGGLPGSFVLGDDALPVCSAGVGQRATATADPALACPPVVRETISDFAFMGNRTSVTFGPDAALPGGTFHYPDGALTSDVTGDDWHIYGEVSQISGFGIYMSGCQQIDAAAYRGLEFTLWGELGEGGALMVFVGSAENEVASSWVNANKASPSDPDEPANLGRCIPLGNRYDGTCREARRPLSVPPEPEAALVLWRDLAEGCPDPGVNPAEITSIAWYFPAPQRGSYSVDIHVDDLRFTDTGPL